MQQCSTIGDTLSRSKTTLAEEDWDVTKEQIKAEIAKLHDEHSDALLYAALIEYLNSNLGYDLRDEYGSSTTVTLIKLPELVTDLISAKDYPIDSRTGTDFCDCRTTRA